MEIKKRIDDCCNGGGKNKIKYDSVFIRNGDSIRKWGSEHGTLLSLGTADVFWAIDMNVDAGRSFFLLSFLLFIFLPLRSVLKTPAIGLRATWAGCPLQIGKWIAIQDIYIYCIRFYTVASKNKDLDGVSIVSPYLSWFQRRGSPITFPQFSDEIAPRLISRLMSKRLGEKGEKNMAV